jgi:hypothetical protein
MCNNFLNFVNSFDYNNWNTSFNRFDVEEKVITHIIKTVKKKYSRRIPCGSGVIPGDVESILKLYGPLMYEEYDEIMKRINKTIKP